jgi:hypothetical protein
MERATGNWYLEDREKRFSQGVEVERPEYRG